MSDDTVTNIRICKLPYQGHPFVHGERGGRDVWLTNNGQWTEVDGHPDADIPFEGGGRPEGGLKGRGMMILKVTSGIAMLLFRNAALMRGILGVAMAAATVSWICWLCNSPPEMDMTSRIFVVGCMVLLTIACGMLGLLPRTAVKNRTGKPVPWPVKGGSFQVGDRVITRWRPGCRGTVLRVDGEAVTVEWDAFGLAITVTYWHGDLLFVNMEPFVVGGRVTLRKDSSCRGTVLHVNMEPFGRSSILTVKWDVCGIANYWPNSLLVAE